MITKHSLHALATLGVALLACLTARPTFSQSANDGFDPNVNGPVNAIVVQADGKIVIGGEFTSVSGVNRANLARINPDGTLDTTFTNGVGSPAPFTRAFIRSLAVQADGRILVGGSFTQVGGFARTNLARLNADGTVDDTFRPEAGTYDSEVLRGVLGLAVQGDERILVAGSFTKLAGQTRLNIGRLNPNGSLDSSFNPSVNSWVESVAVRPDGKILVGGNFSEIDGTMRWRMARLNSNGAVDGLFNPPTVAGIYTKVGLQRDDNVLVGGDIPNRNFIRLLADGSLDAEFSPAVNGRVGAFAVQADGRILVGGTFTTLGGQARTNIGRLLRNGQVDDTFKPDANNGVMAVTVQSDGKVLAGGSFTALGGTNRNRLGRLYPDGSLDVTLNPTVGGTVAALASQPDGKLLIGGAFTNLCGVMITNIARLNADGTADAGFRPELVTQVSCIIVQPDASILVGGAVQVPGGRRPSYIGFPARLNAVGVVDTNFNPNASGGFGPSVRSLALQTDGKILVAGAFTTLGGTNRNCVGRLNPDGSVDTTFDAGEIGGGSSFTGINTIVALADGKILVGGVFTTLGGLGRTNLGRLHADGAVDDTFNSSANGGSPVPGVSCLFVQPDGRILVGGAFATLAGKARNGIGRLNPDGTLDSTFNPIWANAYSPGQSVRSAIVLPNGKIVIGGQLLSPTGGVETNHVMFLNSDGGIDATEQAEATGSDPSFPVPLVYGLSAQADGKILVAGGFTSLSGQARTNLGRLATSRSATQSMDIDSRGTKVTWKRTGTGPELTQVFFEQSGDSMNYAAIGIATHSNSYWQLAGLSLPFGQNFYVRVRGRSTGGAGNGSSGLIEAVAQFYLIPSAHIMSVGKLGSGAFQFSFTNTAGTSYTVLATTNVAGPVASWEVLGAPVPVGNGLYQFTDPGAMNHTRRFYQLRSP